MEPDHYKFGGGANETVLHPVVFLVLVMATILLLAFRRRYTIPTFLFAAFLIPAGQQFVLLGVHIFAYRILVLAALLRIIRFRESPVVAGRWNLVDTAFSLAVLTHATAFTLLYLQMQAVVNQVGFIWDYLGGYIVLRYAIRSREDVVRAIKCLAILAAVFAICMIHEQFTGENVFGLLGGVPQMSEVRDGHIRSQGAFQHAILAGTFGAIIMPLFIFLYRSVGARVLAVAGAVSASIMTFTTACSTPALTYAAGIGAILFWPLRKCMWWIRWSIIFGLFVLNFVMHAPVWYLIAHVGVFGGSSVNHRADLVDTFIRHFGDWWLLGTDANNNWGHDMFDTSNQYVQQGVTGGLLSLISLILTIASAFSRIGRARRAVEGQRDREWFLWILGCCVFANTVAFFGISYFDQTRVAWFVLLAIVCASTARGTWPVPLRASEKPLANSLPSTELISGSVRGGGTSLRVSL